MFKYFRSLFIIFYYFPYSCVADNSIDICGVNSNRRYYLEYGESGTLVADFQNNISKDKLNVTNQMRCSIEFITCPSCIVEIKFRFINISRFCGKSPIFDRCGCNYVLVYEPSFEDVSGEQFCGRYAPNNSSDLSYRSLARSVATNFIFSTEYGHAFTLDYYVDRNRIHYKGHPTISNMNNSTQYVSSPFFPYLYPVDLIMEYVIHCDVPERCRISLVFTDFLLADSSIVEFFDWNGQRIYVTSGSAFRPPLIISSGPALVLRFYANGASGYGFKASFMFILGDSDDFAYKPSVGCGGYVNNLGGGIIMTDMVTDGTKLFDCVWLIKPPESFLHRKTHLYGKVVTFSGFAGSTELIIRQGLTSNQPPVEVLRYPLSHLTFSRPNEHIVPISQGFYVSLKGLFRPESNVIIVYSTFNYKDCFAGADYICHNLRCIPAFLTCDGLNHCGDNSDESKNCSLDPRDHRGFSKIPNFLFPKIDPYADLTAATLVFIMCSFGLIGIILVMALLLYRVNMKARHQRQIQDHIDTIHAILEERVEDIEEEIIVPDEPPDYEHPPEYAEVLKLQKYIKEKLNKRQEHYSFHMDQTNNISSFRCHFSTDRSRKALKSVNSGDSEQTEEVGQNSSNNSACSNASNCKSCQTTPIKIPESPPPAYEKIKNPEGNEPFNLVMEESLRCESGGSCIIIASDDSSSPFTSLQSTSTLRDDKITCFKEIEISYSRKRRSPVLDSKKCNSDESIYRHFSKSIDAKIKHLYWNSNIKSKVRKSFSSENIFDL